MITKAETQIRAHKHTHAKRCDRSLSSGVKSNKHTRDVSKKLGSDVGREHRWMMVCVCVKQCASTTNDETKANEKTKKENWISAAHVNWPEYIQNPRTALRNMYNIKFDGTTYVAILAVPPVIEVLHKYTSIHSRDVDDEAMCTHVMSSTMYDYMAEWMNAPVCTRILFYFFFSRSLFSHFHSARLMCITFDSNAASAHILHTFSPLTLSACRMTPTHIRKD